MTTKKTTANPMLGQDILDRLTWALGIPLTGREAEIVLTIKPFEVVKVSVTSLVYDQATPELETVIKDYHLVAVPAAVEPIEGEG